MNLLDNSIANGIFLPQYSLRDRIRSNIYILTMDRPLNSIVAVHSDMNHCYRLEIVFSIKKKK